MGGDPVLEKNSLTTRTGALWGGLVLGEYYSPRFSIGGGIDMSCPGKLALRPVASFVPQRREIQVQKELSPSRRDGTLLFAGICL